MTPSFGMLTGNRTSTGARSVPSALNGLAESRLSAVALYPGRRVWLAVTMLGGRHDALQPCHALQPCR
jgi:hypothetical protein